MPIHINEMTSDVTVYEGDLPLNQAQIERLVRLVLQRLEEEQSARRLSQYNSQFRSTAIPSTMPE